MNAVLRTLGISVAVFLYSSFEIRAEVSYAYAQTLADLEVAAMNSGFSEEQATTVIHLAVLIANNQLCDRPILKSNDDIAIVVNEAAKSSDIPGRLLIRKSWEAAKKLGDFIQSDNSEWLRFCSSKK